MVGSTVGELLQVNVATTLIFIKVKSVFQQSQSDICFIDYHLHTKVYKRKENTVILIEWGL